MQARKTEGEHRAATEIELFFGLVFVIAIALAAVDLNHPIVEIHYFDGLIKFMLAIL